MSSGDVVEVRQIDESGIVSGTRQPRRSLKCARKSYSSGNAVESEMQ